MTFLYIILDLINPSGAISELVNTGLLGSVVVLLIWYVIHNDRKRDKERSDFIDAINKERIYKDKESNESDKQFIEYLQTNNVKLVEIIKKNTEASEKFSTLLNEFLIYIKMTKNE